MKIVLVDLDGTLIPHPSVERRFFRHLLKSGYIGPRQLLAAAAFTVRGSPLYGRHVWKKNKAYLAGLPAAEIEAIAGRFARERIVPLLRPALARRLRQHRARGDFLVLLTGTLDVLARPVAERLGFAHCICTQLTQRDGRYTAQPPLVHPFGEDKLRLAEEFLRRIEGRFSDVVAYADSVDDVPLLQRAGRAIAVCPDRGLRVPARESAWTIIR